MRLETVSYRLPEWTVAVRSAHPEAFGYLDSFHDRGPADTDAAADTVLDAEPDPRAPVPEFAFQPVRHRIRELWEDRLRSGTALNLHAAAVDDGETVLAFVGERVHGKTTLLLDHLLRDRRAGRPGGYLSNDNLVAYVRAGEVMLTTIPTYLKVRTRPAARYEELLAATAGRSGHGTAMWRRYRQDPAGFPFHTEAMLPPAGFGAARLPVVPLAARRLVLVAVGFTDGEPAVSRPWPAAERQDLITANLKWSAGRADALVRRLCAGSSAVGYRHAGSVEPLLAGLSAGALSPC
jgi:hypothetical protein